MINLWGYSLNMMKKWNYIEIFPLEISQIISMVFTMQKNKVSNNEIVHKIMMKLQVFNKGSKKRYEEDEDENQIIEENNNEQEFKFDISVTPLTNLCFGHKDIIAPFPGLQTKSILLSNDESFKRRTINFMYNEFPITGKSRYKNIYLVEALPFFKKKCLLSTEIPQRHISSSKKKDINDNNTKSPSNDLKGKLLRKKLKFDLQDNYFNYKYTSNFSLFHYHLLFSHSEISPVMTLKFLELVKEIWGNPFKSTIFPYQEDIALKFLAICNYDIYKALYDISFLQPSYLRFLIESYDIFN